MSLEIKKFDISKMDKNTEIVIIAKRKMGMSWINSLKIT